MDPAICFCGVVDAPTCDETDWAYCKDCDWEAQGRLSEHLGQHHHKATGHTWKLVWRDVEI